MQKSLVLVLLMLGFVLNVEDSQGRLPRYNRLFNYTHMLPSPFTLGAGQLVYGTRVAFGVTDFLTVGTNVLRDIYQFYNADAKVAIVDTPYIATALTLGWQSYNLKDISASNPDTDITSYSPGAVVALAVGPRVAWFVGGNYNITDVTINTGGLKTTGLVQGVTGQSDISWAYNPPSRGTKVARGDSVQRDSERRPARKRRRRRSSPVLRKVGNVISVGASYDVTYKLYGVGLSHHWPGFQLGFHYYPQADERKILPIIAGGGSMQF